MGFSFEPEIYFKALSVTGARYQFQRVLAFGLIRNPDREVSLFSQLGRSIRAIIFAELCELFAEAAPLPI
jgi:hypothetical protein